MRHSSSSGRTSDRERLRIILAHGDRATAFTVRPALAVSLLAGCALLMAGYVGAAGYLMLRDDGPARPSVAQLRQARAYEDRIADLRARIDRITSRSLVAQHTYEQQIEALTKRQGEIDARHARVADVLARAAETGLSIAAAGPLPPEKPRSPLGPAMEAAATAGLPESLETAPVDASPTDFAPVDFALRGSMETPARKANRMPVTRPVADTPAADNPPLQPAPATDPARSDKMVMNRIGNALEVMDRQSETALDLIAVTAERHIARIERVTRSLGLKVDDTGNDAVGGPFEPLASDTSFDDRLARAERAVARLSALRDGIRSLPLAAPIDGPLSVSSEYGARLDPFLGTPAMHTGVDLRAAYGAPVHATAAGKVVSAGPNGGYGLMVEIDHGNGISTRYGHMSRVLVTPGEHVAAGAVIGEAGSTGRSTGTHVHYETRLRSGPVDPETFLGAGEKLAGIL